MSQFINFSNIFKGRRCGGKFTMSNRLQTEPRSLHRGFLSFQVVIETSDDLSQPQPGHPRRHPPIRAPATAPLRRFLTTPSSSILSHRSSAFRRLLCSLDSAILRLYVTCLSASALRRLRGSSPLRRSYWNSNLSFS